MTYTRLKAFELFQDIVRRGAYSNLSAGEKLSDDMTTTEKGFITALVYGTVDKIINIDYIIAQYAHSRIQQKAEDVLRLSVYQLLYMDIPDYTVCDEAVKLVAAVGKRELKGFVNAIMRSVQRGRDSIVYPDERKEPDRYYSVKYSYPQFLVKEMLAENGLEETKKALDYVPDNRTAVRCNTARITAEEFADYLKEHNYDICYGKYFNYVFYVTGNRIFNDNLFQNGFCSSQSEPSVLVCKAMDVQPGERVFDLCAAPGGKSVCMAEQMGSGSIIACDLHPHRVELIGAYSRRCKTHDIINPVVQDATVFNPDFGLADRVLCDVPCSGLGVVSGKPDIKLRSTPEKLSGLEKIQSAILNNAAKYVAPGGMLVYSTCTTRRKENQEQAARFLASHPDFEIAPLDALAKEVGLKKALTIDGYIKLVPHIHETEGFFVARFRRKGTKQESVQ